MLSGYGSLQCHWFIHARPGHKILLYFDVFEVEGNPAGMMWHRLRQKWTSTFARTYGPMTFNQGLSSWPDCLQSAAARLLPWGFGHGGPRQRLPSSCAVTLWTPTNRSSPRQTSSSSPSTSQTRPSGLKDSRQPGRKSRWFTSRILRYIDSGCLTSGCSQLQQSNGIQVSELFLLYF